MIFSMPEQTYVPVFSRTNRIRRHASRSTGLGPARGMLQMMPLGNPHRGHRSAICEPPCRGSSQLVAPDCRQNAQCKWTWLRPMTLVHRKTEESPRFTEDPVVQARSSSHRRPSLDRMSDGDSLESSIGAKGETDPGSGGDQSSNRSETLLGRSPVGTSGTPGYQSHTVPPAVPRYRRQHV